MSETDKEFLDGLIGRPITVSDRVRLFALARRGAEAAARIEQLEAALHRISLGSQNSSTTKEGLGREARAALEGKL